MLGLAKPYGETINFNSASIEPRTLRLRKDVVMRRSCNPGCLSCSCMHSTRFGAVTKLSRKGSRRYHSDCHRWWFREDKKLSMNRCCWRLFVLCLRSVTCGVIGIKKIREDLKDHSRRQNAANGKFGLRVQIKYAEIKCADW